MPYAQCKQGVPPLTGKASHVTGFTASTPTVVAIDNVIPAPPNEFGQATMVRYDQNPPVFAKANYSGPLNPVVPATVNPTRNTQTS